MTKIARKNLILMTIDSLRADHLSCLGYHKKTTPKLDSLAENGALFTQAVSNGPGTAQSFPSILTSTYPLMYGGYEGPLSEERITIAEILRKYGYSTAAFHSNPYLSSHFDYNRGFDVFEDFMGTKPKRESTITKIRDIVRDAVKRVLRRESLVYALPTPLREAYLRRHLLGYRARAFESADVINEKAISWLKNNPDGFFLWLHYMKPHNPYIPSDKFRPKTMDWSTVYKLIMDFRRALRDPNFIFDELDGLISLYDSKIRSIDHDIGLFLNKIKEMGIWQNTFIIVTADHGEEFLDHGGISHTFRLYEELIHVPLIIAGQGIKKNTVVKDLVGLLDISPTIIGLLGIASKPNSFLGRSLVPAIRGQKCEGSMGVISESKKKKGRVLSYRTDEWKYILTLDGKNIREELYNLKKDPREIKDLSNKEEIKPKLMEFKSKLFKHISMEEKTTKTVDEKMKVRQKIRVLKRLSKI